MIEIENVHESFGTLEVLKGVSMTVERGEVVSVIGGSGSGKSTLLMCINGLEPIGAGRVVVDGVDVARARHRPQPAQAEDRHRVSAMERLPASDRA